MSLSATARLDDALEATKSLLLPVEAGTWIRLALIAFFVGGIGGGFPGSFNVGGSARGGGSNDVALPQFDEVLEGLGPVLGPGTGELVVVLAVVAAIVGLAFLYVGSVLEFVLVEALVTREVTVRERFGARRWQGTRLFAFRIGLFLLVALLVAAAVALGLALQGPGIRVLAILFAVPVLLLAGTVAAVVNGFTTVFVVPIMLEERCGVVEGWRRLRPSIGEETTGFGVYLLLSVVLGAVGGTLVATIVGVFALVLFLPVGLLGLAALFSGGPLAVVLLAPVAFAVLLGLAALGAVVSVPVVTYLRYYALLVLADLTEYDLVADVRADVGADPASDVGGEGRA